LGEEKVTNKQGGWGLGKATVNPCFWVVVGGFSMNLTFLTYIDREI